MSGDPIAIEPWASALEALDLMSTHGIRHLPVVDGERSVVGVLSLDDLRAALPFPLDAPPSAEERDQARSWSVSDVMSYAPVTISETTDLAEAAQKMADGRLGCLPVVDEEDRLAGILSETDVLQALVTRLWTDRVREERRDASELERLVTELEREREAIAQRDDELAARRLAAIDRALERAADGRLDTCDRCGGRIPIVRLRALPGTEVCIACAR